MDVIYQKKNRLLWKVLSFQGGFINIGGLLAVHQFVSHVTGYFGHFAISIIDQKFSTALIIFMAPFSFFAGSFFSALLVDSRREKNLKPFYELVFFLMSVLYFLVALGGYYSYFGVFGEAFDHTRDYILMGFLCFACGLQNALITSYSGAVIRTTHMTGVVTDLGIGLVRYYKSNHHEDIKKMNIVRWNLICYFFGGSLVGVLLFQRFEYLSFLMAALISIVLALRFYFLSKESTSLS